MENYIQRYRCVDRAGRHRQRPVEISLANRESTIDAQGLSSAATNRECSSTQVKANAGTASRLHEEGQRAARTTTQIKELRGPGKLQPRCVEAQIRGRHPRVLPDVFAIGFDAKLT